MDELWVMFFLFKQKTAYEMRISDWSSDVCSSDLSCLGPDEGLRMSVVAGDERIDVVLELLDAGEAGALKGVSGQDREPDLDLVEPARVGRGEEIGRASCRERVCQYV